MPYGLSSEEVEWIRAGYRMFIEGDPAFMDRFAPDAEIIIPPTLPAGGTYSGPFDAMEFWTTIGELYENPTPRPNEFLRAGDRVIVSGVWSATVRSTGEAIESPFVHAFRLEAADGTLMERRYISMELFIDTAAILQSLGEIPPPN